MNRIKVITDITELIPILRAVNTPVKKKVLNILMSEWKSMDEIVKEYGEDGREALIALDKMNLVETKWDSKGKPKMIYHTSYNSFHFDATASIEDISDILSVAMMNQDEYSQIEHKILEIVNDEGKFIGDLAEEMNMSRTMLKSIVKRSNKIIHRGHRIEKI